jgi:retron-type reverse transcriptase
MCSPKFNITPEFIKNSIDRLDKIKLYKKKIYIKLTKDFLTDPNFLLLAYLQIKSKQGNMTPNVDKETLDGIDKNWFINAANKIKTNKYQFKPAKVITIPGTNDKGFKLLTIGSSKDKMIQKAIYLILNQIYEYEDKVFLDVSHGSRPGHSVHTALKQIKTKWTSLY